MATPPLALPTVAPAAWRPADADAFVAIGLLSAAGGYAHVTHENTRRRRDQIRLSVASSLIDGRTALRFVLNSADGTLPAAVHSESTGMRDMVWLKMADAPHRCGYKYVLWLSKALSLFPRAAYIMLGDDDIFFLPHRLEADLASVHRIAHDSLPEDARTSYFALYGLIMFKPYYNNETFSPSTGYTGWEPQDWNVRVHASPARGSQV